MKTMLKSIAVLLAVMLSFAATASAQGNAANAKFAAKPIKFTEYDLPNGLHVILHEDHSVPVVASYVLYHVGSKDERPDRTGFAHFFEHLMFEGTENIKRGEIDKYVSGAGGNLNASTSFDQTDYYINLPANQLKLALWIESERMMHGKVEEIGIETQRKVVKEERKVRLDNQPYGTILEQLAANAFMGTPYSWTPIGSAQYIDLAKASEFQDFYKTYYVPNNATLSLAGDLDIEQTKKLIEAYFGPIPRGKDVPRPAVTVTPPTAPKMVDVKKDNTPLPATILAWQGPKETEPDAYALEMLTQILGTGKSSRLYKQLVDKSQAAVQVQAFPFFQEKAGMAGLLAIGNSGVSIEKLDEMLKAEIENVKQNGVSDEEYQKSINQQETGAASANGSMQNRAKNLARYHTFYGNANLVNTELENYLKVSRDDLKRVANKYLTKEGVTVIHYTVPVQEAPKPAPDNSKKPN